MLHEKETFVNDSDVVKKGSYTFLHALGLVTSFPISPHVRSVKSTYAVNVHYKTNDQLTGLYLVHSFKCF